MSEKIKKKKTDRQMIRNYKKINRTHVVKHPITLDSWPSAKAAKSPGVPQAMATDKKAVYMAPMWAAPEAKK